MLLASKVGGQLFFNTSRKAKKLERNFLKLWSHKIMDHRKDTENTINQAILLLP